MSDLSARLNVTAIVKNAVILPWFAFLFGAISSVLSLAAARRARYTSAPAAAAPTAASEPAPSFKEKGDTNIEQVQV